MFILNSFLNYKSNHLGKKKYFLSFFVIKDLKRIYDTIFKNIKTYLLYFQLNMYMLYLLVSSTANVVKSSWLTVPDLSMYIFMYIFISNLSIHKHLLLWNTAVLEIHGEMPIKRLGERYLYALLNAKYLIWLMPQTDRYTT